MAGNNDVLVQRIVEIIKSHVNPRQGLTNLSRNQNIAPAITEIIKKSIPEAPKVIVQAPPDDVVRAIVRAIQNGTKLTGPIAGAAVGPMVQEGAPVAPTVNVIQAAPVDDVVRAIVRAVQMGIPVSREVLNAAEKKKRGFFQKIMNIFRPKNKMPEYGPETQPNFMNATTNTPPPPGYVLTTRNGKTGWFRNKGPVAGPVAAGPVAGPVAAGPPRNYTKMSVRELLDALRKYPENRPTISEALRRAIEKALRDIQYEYSRSRRVRKLGDLLRLLPRNYPGRRDASSMIVNDVRETRNDRELTNVRSNLGSVPNENIRRALENQRRRFQRKKNDERRNRSPGTYNLRRSREDVVRRPSESNNEYEIRRRRAALENVNRARRVDGGGIENVNTTRRVVGGNGGGVYAPENGGGVPPPLPSNQNRAITNVGGVNKAMNTVMNVPGGASEVAKAAEALNETHGDANLAVQIKGASPEAVKAVQNLGGPKNTVVILEGLNTLSRKTKRVARPKKKKTKSVRVAELNRVINAVKKQRLISLVAHNVTKTHNIHPNDEKLKKYYKKVLKANILRTPFAKIVRKASVSSKKRAP